MAKIHSLNGCLGATVSVILMNISAWSEDISVSRASRTFPNALPGKVVTIEKVFDTKTKRLYLRSDHESVQSAASLFGLEQAEANLVRQKNGALHEELVEKLKSMGDRDEVQVLVSLREPEGIVYLDKFGDCRPEATEKRWNHSGPVCRGEKAFRGGFLRHCMGLQGSVIAHGHGWGDRPDLRL